MISTDELFTLLDARRIELGLSQAEVGRRAFGQADGSALQNIRRGSSPTFEKLQRLCEVLGVDLELGSAQPKAVSNTASADLTSREFAQVPLHSASLAAGSGAHNHREDIVDYLAFRRDWLKKIGLPAASAVIARAEGDSMQPSIWHGDLVLIDRSRTEVQVTKPTGGVRRSPIYALLHDGKARIKRIDRPAEDQVILLSDNPDYGPQLVRAETLSIIGKVMWWGHTNRE